MRLEEDYKETDPRQNEIHQAEQDKNEFWYSKLVRVKRNYIIT